MGFKTQHRTKPQTCGIGCADERCIMTSLTLGRLDMWAKARVVGWLHSRCSIGCRACSSVSSAIILVLAVVDCCAIVRVNAHIKQWYLVAHQTKGRASPRQRQLTIRLEVGGAVVTQSESICAGRSFKGCNSVRNGGSVRFGPCGRLCLARRDRRPVEWARLCRRAGQGTLRERFNNLALILRGAELCAVRDLEPVSQINDKRLDQGR